MSSQDGLPDCLHIELIALAVGDLVDFFTSKTQPIKTGNGLGVQICHNTKYCNYIFIMYNKHLAVSQRISEEFSQMELVG